MLDDGNYVVHGRVTDTNRYEVGTTYADAVRRSVCACDLPAGDTREGRRGTNGTLAVPAVHTRERENGV